VPVFLAAGLRVVRAHRVGDPRVLCLEAIGMRA